MSNKKTTKSIKHLKRKGIGPQRTYFNETCIDTWHVRNHGIRTIADYDLADWTLQRDLSLEDTQFPERYKQFEAGYPKNGYAHSIWIRFLSRDHSDIVFSVFSCASVTLTDLSDPYYEFTNKHLPHDTEMTFGPESKAGFSQAFFETTYNAPNIKNPEEVEKMLRALMWETEKRNSETLRNHNWQNVGIIIETFDDGEPHYIASCPEAMARISIKNYERDILKLSETEDFEAEFNAMKKKLKADFLIDLYDKLEEVAIRI